MPRMDWAALKCRFGCDSAVVGIYYAATGCICFEDKIQALCAQHAVKGQQNNDMIQIMERWQCTARPWVRSDPPQDCDWPTCGCDPYANKVVDALVECGHLKRHAQDS